MSATINEQVSNKAQAQDMMIKIAHWPRSSWIKKGSKAKSNENIEIPRELARELADKTVYYYLALELLPCDPFCDCKKVEALLLKAVQELPEGETADELEQVVFGFCPVCGKRFEVKGGG